MASIKAIHSDIVYEILDDLDRKDIVSLLQTCKHFYPLCYRYLWTVLIFNNRYNPGNWYPGREIWGSKIVFRNLLKLIREGNSLGFQHTRVLWLGRPIFNKQLRSVSWDLRRYLKKLLENGELDLREAIVYYSNEALAASEDPHRARDGDCMVPLHALHKYTQSKSIHDFSLRIEASTIRSFLTYFNAELITHFEVSLNFDKAGDPNFPATFTSINGPMEVHIVEFRTVIRGMVNLVWFSWKALTQASSPQYATVHKELEELQAVFSTFNKLREMKLDGYVFHPSFFLVPSEGVKKLSISGVMSPVWWKKFAAAPLTNVEVLDLKTESGEPNSDHPTILWEPNTDNTDFLIKDVACRGLKRITIRNDIWMPHDLEVCILRRNPDLDRTSLREAALQKANALLGEISFILRSRSRRAASTLRSRIPRSILEGSGGAGENTIKLDIAQAFSELFNTNNYEGTSVENLNNSIGSWEEFGGIGAGRRQHGTLDQLRDHLDNCIEMVLDKYVHRYGNFPPPGKQPEFIADCIKTLGNRDEIQEWIKRKREAQWFLRNCENKVLNDADQQHKPMAEELADRILAGEILNQEHIMDKWKGLLVEGFEGFGLEG
ncbi:hypothetical protein TWF225_000315 [Orbilia oligospora]|uniref:Uncharacterized protein n=1 Tax=Orbilia oligospora TaxID=2813651 RepID=A0A7C8PXW7_ORBOL|nr:hypothetical protein TWF751_004352 [Orbilia oligospora]KAF3195958.1 hypothetical protein TWF225_000315 [Orbilia oligospora]KAF3266544.1 hypothetical protein TWF128_010931 [Orbilia oligospora]KAF3272130.1 hypothetical protein TWF217_003938 [Orbilia oligospora]KAF3297701.1 hypothetical protein TWF132_006105 [Orbilia oligospora]